MSIREKDTEAKATTEGGEEAQSTVDSATISEEQAKTEMAAENGTEAKEEKEATEAHCSSKEFIDELKSLKALRGNNVGKAISLLKDIVQHASRLLKGSRVSLQVLGAVNLAGEALVLVTEAVIPASEPWLRHMYKAWYEDYDTAQSLWLPHDCSSTDAVVTAGELLIALGKASYVHPPLFSKVAKLLLLFMAHLQHVSAAQWHDIIEASYRASTGMDLTVFVEAAFAVSEDERVPGYCKSIVHGYVSRTLLLPQGVEAVLSVALSTAAESSIDKVQEQMVRIISQVPLAVTTPEEYLRKTAPQLLQCLDAGRTALGWRMRDIAAIILSRWLHTATAPLTPRRKGREVLRHVIEPLLLPLRGLARSHLCRRRPSHKGAALVQEVKSEGDANSEPDVASISPALRRAVERLHRILTVQVATPYAAETLLPVVPGLLSLYVLCKDSKDAEGIAAACQEILSVVLSKAPSAQTVVLTSIAQYPAPTYVLGPGNAALTTIPRDLEGVLSDEDIAEYLSDQERRQETSAEAHGSALALSSALIAAWKQRTTTDHDVAAAVFVELLTRYLEYVRTFRDDDPDGSAKAMDGILLPSRVKRNADITEIAGETKHEEEGSIVGEKIRVLTVISQLASELGPSVLRSTSSLLDVLNRLLAEIVSTLGLKATAVTDTAATAQSQSDDIPYIKAAPKKQAQASALSSEQEEELNELLVMCLGLLTSCLSGTVALREMDRKGLKALVPVLAALEQHPHSEVSEMTVVLRSTILLLGDEHSSGDSPSAPQSRIDIAGEEESTEENSHSMDHLAELRRGLAELKHEHAAMRGGGLLRLSEWVLSTGKAMKQGKLTVQGDAVGIDEHCRRLFKIAVSELRVEEPYVLHAALLLVQSLMDCNAEKFLPATLRLFADEGTALPVRLKLGEALVVGIRRLGKAGGHFAPVLVGAFMKAGLSARSNAYHQERTAPVGGNEEGITHQLDSMWSELRASCLSGIAEVALHAGVALTRQLENLIGGCLAILEMERANGSKLVRRAAAYALFKVVEGTFGDDIATFAKAHTKLLSGMEHIYVMEGDDVVRHHLSLAFSRVQQQIGSSIEQGMNSRSFQVGLKPKLL